MLDAKSVRDILYGLVVINILGTIYSYDALVY